jgi:hypothetical protein
LAIEAVAASFAARLEGRLWFSCALAFSESGGASAPITNRLDVAERVKELGLAAGIVLLVCDVDKFFMG